MRVFPSGTAILNAVASIGGTQPHRGIRYGDRPRQVLDVYRTAAARPSPTIVFFYGGGWEEGERGGYCFLGSALAARGFVTVIPDYRIFPEVRFPAFVEDGAEALRWVTDNIEKFGGDHRRLVVMGHSAGAYIAAMLAFDRKRLAMVGLDAGRSLKAMIGLAGPYDFLPLRSATLKEIFGPEPGLAATQPINFVEADAPPAFLATGRRDRVVDPANTMRLAARLVAVGGNAQVKLYGHVGHGTLIGAFARPLRFLAPVLEDVVHFAREMCGVDAFADMTAARERIA